MIAYISLITCLSVTPVKINKTATDWTSEDISKYNEALVQCSEIYPDAPKLSTFIKVMDNVYKVYCCK